MLRSPAVAALLLLAGCYPVTRMQTPRTTPAGRVHGALGVAMSQAHADTVRIVPDVWLGVGLHDRIELSLRTRLVAIEIGGKLQLVREAVEVSLAPALIAAHDYNMYDELDDAPGSVSVKAARATLYVGSDGDQVVSAWIAPTVDAGQRSRRPRGASRQPFVAPGLLAGLVFGPGHGTRLLVEGGVLVPRAGDGPIDRTDAVARLGPGDTRFELNVALRFGAND